MEIIFSFILALISFLFGGGEVQFDATRDLAVPEMATVVRVIDGDTIKVMIDGQEEAVRYIGIDTPEPYRDGQPACYSQAATARNTELVAGAQVALISDTEDRDKYDRLLRYVYVDEVFVNELLVAEGYATTLRIEPNTTEATTLQQAEDTARAQALGLWGACTQGGAASATDIIPAVPVPIEIDTTSLPAGQQQVLETLGVDESLVTISPQVITCAKEAIGSDRVDAITGGDTPSFIEGIKLANCYRANE
jgi:micrococcal nuclease